MDAAPSFYSSSSSSSISLLQRVITAEELAADTRKFAAFQWAIGIGEAQQILCRPEEDAAAATAAAADAEQQQQEKPTIKFRGWEAVSEVAAATAAAAAAAAEEFAS
ncbi:hypothetical protein, conserved [Eimeria tenella]|uniref:Uncharacterized protein n=1 Tax=Eimeria tenella TaxID=5802 RepID=U6KSX1_EIMTE|nr:hypothetical protein, conserved [Eimeria tenella]CDJ39454.1 hypothetical protein, conserved [Eimeria tenella]|eukprot:XP_013230209.1 hypothetical protein, conserved [Eimeria tenella]